MAKRTISGFTYSFTIEENSFVCIEASNILLKRIWKTKIKELSFYNGTTQLVTLNYSTLNEILCSESPEDCEVIFPKEIPTNEQLCIEIVIVVPFIGRISSFIKMNESNVNEIERLEQSIIELSKVSNERIRNLEKQLKEAQKELTNIKEQISTKTGLVNVCHFSDKSKIECDLISSSVLGSISSSSYNKKCVQLTYTGFKFVFDKKYCDSKIMIQGLITGFPYFSNLYKDTFYITKFLWVW